MLKGMSKTFRPYDVQQQLLLPPSLQDWVPEDHLARFVSDVVEDALDLSTIYSVYDEADPRGRPPYHPAMLVKLLVYGYCTGVRSSRKIERATYDDVAFRFLSADQHPDHDSIAAFRKRHLTQLAGLFKQVLLLCEKAGLVKLGHVAIDGTKVKANASKHKAMSYDRMPEAERRLEQEVQRLLEEAAHIDEEEDRRFGKGKRGDELPPELARRESRLAKIREAKAALEQEAKEKAAKEAEIAKQKQAERERRIKEKGKKYAGREPKMPDPEQAKPEPKAQRNFTDPDSRIMVDGATKGFVQAYNAQAAVDGEHQIVVASMVSQQSPDNGHLLPMLERVRQNLGMPSVVSADSGYYSEANVRAVEAEVNLLVPPNQREGKEARKSGSGTPASQTAEAMRSKLLSDEGRGLYRLRKAIVEPVFGQMKEGRGFRRFSFRGLAHVTAEWDFMCLTHNLLKLFQVRGRLRTA